MAQRAIQRWFCVWVAGEQVRRGQIRRWSLYDGWLVNPAEGCAGPVYIPPRISGSSKRDRGSEFLLAVDLGCCEG